MNNETTETKLSGHIKKAVTAIEKEIFRLNTKVVKWEDKAINAYKEVEILRSEIEGLQAQISKLKGE